jgi:hypothetical protein
MEAGVIPFDRLGAGRIWWDARPARCRIRCARFGSTTIEHQVVERGIDSLSLNADAFARTRTRVFEVEQAKKRRGATLGAQST